MTCLDYVARTWHYNLKIINLCPELTYFCESCSLLMEVIEVGEVQREEKLFLNDVF